jgi:MoaA/NifB/PqqE/SkfB family radical SAM enzyme
MQIEYTLRLQEVIKSNIRQHFKKSPKSISWFLFYFRMFRWQTKANKIRKSWKDLGYQAPPFLAISVTNKCNLKCKGCYANSKKKCPEEEMDNKQLRYVIEQARDLGISFILILGGEPLIRGEIIEILHDFSDIIFILFTNGLLLNPENISIFRRYKNIIPLISLEGPKEVTDERRGKGVFDHSINVMNSMNSKKMYFGTTITVTRENFSQILGEKFISSLLQRGCKIIGFIEYIPVEKGTEYLAITPEQRTTKMNLISQFRKNNPGIFIIDLPGDESHAGGCLSCGRGFAHVSPEGNIEPCVFFPISDSNVKTLPLVDALQSPLFETIRNDGEELQNTRRGCALWENRHLLDEKSIKMRNCSLNKVYTEEG